MSVDTRTRLAVFPLAGAVLFPRMHLPLHIFEPRYRAMVQHALSTDQRLDMDDLAHAAHVEQRRQALC